jgi:hypothetical protein
MMKDLNDFPASTLVWKTDGSCHAGARPAARRTSSARTIFENHMLMFHITGSVNYWQISS